MAKKNDGKKGFKPIFTFNLTWLYVVIAVVLGILYFTQSDSSMYKSATYSQFKEYVNNGYAEKITVQKDEGTLRMFVKKEYIREIFKTGPDKVNGTPYVSVEYGSIENLENFIDTQTELGKFNGKFSFEHSQDFSHILFTWLPILFFTYLIFTMFRRVGSGGGGGFGGGIFNVGQSKAKLIDKDNKDEMKVTFKDVAGQEGAKQEVQEIVDFLKNPAKYTELGGKIPKGALLVGPPGTGKTLLAKAVAGEADVPFFSMSGSDFVEMFVGVGASRVRDLFSKAKAKAPCIIFIDEIDAVGRARSNKASFGGNDERESTLNQLLTEMDGFGTNSGVIILAATNRADILDKALLRAGRFDRQIHVELPELNERKAIFGVHLRPLKINETVDVNQLARQTPGFSGADIANVCNEAALIAARHEATAVSRQDFLDAIDRIIGGLEKKTKIMTNAEKRSIAIHEAGHATLSWFLQHANPLVKVSIVPRGISLGAAWYMPEERQITTKEHILDELCSLLGGRAAEELFTNHIGTGALNDLERANRSAYSMVAYMGMSDELPNICFYNNNEYEFSKPYSEATAHLIDKEVAKILAEQYKRAKDMLKEHAEGHNKLADLLVEKEVIMAEDLEAIFGPRPWQSRSEEIFEENPELKAEYEAELKARAEAMAAKAAEEDAEEARLAGEEQNQTEDNTPDNYDKNEKSGSDNA
ncbi:MAG: ATP-dependent zinc metalloprotease FtsH [Bacteroidaceae bacterium]|nr:ATP-dependent zinc metalloprotease FtsH [Bacteroidaceae bacterium]